MYPDLPISDEDWIRTLPAVQRLVETLLVENETLQAELEKLWAEVKALRVEVARQRSEVIGWRKQHTAVFSEQVEDELLARFTACLGKPKKWLDDFR